MGWPDIVDDLTGEFIADLKETEKQIHTPQIRQAFEIVNRNLDCGEVCRRFIKKAYMAGQENI
jgi:hypothetical protein|tara:strand:+ start:14105 stop:14293 length:189 start_codon:yes stop_codon:yes gene_type:complete